MRVATLTISTSRSAGSANDEGTPALAEFVAARRNGALAPKLPEQQAA